MTCPTRLFLLLALLSLAAPAEAKKKPKAEPPPVAATEPSIVTTDGEISLWSDPMFRNSFLGSYGVRSEVEPSLGPVERERLETVLPLLAGDLEAAASALEALTGPDASALFDFTLANVRFQQGELDAAAASYRSALEKYPSYLRAHENLGIIEVRRGRLGEALTHLSRVVQLGGGSGLVYGLIGYCHAGTGQPVAAESAYRSALLLQPEQLDWKLGLTQAVLKQEKWEESASLCEELIRRFPDEADYWLLQASAYIGMGRPLHAAQNYELVERMGEASASVLFTLGDIYVNEGLWDLAVRAHSGALEKDRAAGLDGALSRVEAMAQRGAFDAARTLLRNIEGLQESVPDPDLRRRMLKIEARIAVAQGEGGEAVGVLEEIVALDPLDGEALLLLARHHGQAGDEEQALFYYERAAALEEHEGEAKTRQGQLLVNMGRYGEALPLLKRAQELEPRDDVAQFIEQVERAARARR